MQLNFLRLTGLNLLNRLAGFLYRGIKAEFCLGNLFLFSRLSTD